MKYYGASDFSVTPQAGDYTCHAVVGVDQKDHIYVVDWWRGKVGPDEGIDQMISMMRKWKPIAWAQEKGVIDRSLGPFMKKRMIETKTHVHTVRFPSVLEKEARAQSILGRISMGMVHFPRHCAWWPDLRSELIRYPHGTYDDQVDTMALIGRMLAGMIGGRMPEAGPEPGRTLIVGGKEVANYNALTLNDLWAQRDLEIGRSRRRRGRR